jgi:hypothetical protein
LKLVIPDPDRVGSSAPQEIPGFGVVPATLEALGLSEAAVKEAIKAGVPVKLVTQKEEA